MMQVEITGWKEIEKRANEAARIIQAFNVAATRENVKDLQIQAREKAPYKTGALKRSILTKTFQEDGSTVYGQVGSDLPYARILELGGTIKAHDIVPRSRKFLAFKAGAGFTANKDGMVFAKRVHIKAQTRQAQPYLMPALIEGMERYLGRYREAWAEAEKQIGTL